MPALLIAADHAGFELKEALKQSLDRRGVPYRDLGTSSTDSVDYPDFAHRLAEAIASGEAERGLLVCGSGQGMAMAANRHHGVRAALALDEESARLSREHNDANVLSLGARLTSPDEAERILDVFLGTPFAGGRHERRVSKIEPS
ncbi:MAG TPA: ribose 5-phosphate isomerase B [Vicinamibacteria bacterium]|nr:ribose 5-phosphate isomerase B [Vicinamibacteria bacterium]